MKPSEAVFFLAVFFFIVMPPLDYTYLVFQLTSVVAIFMFTRTYEDEYIVD
jgi:hypothetical protein